MGPPGPNLSKGPQLICDATGARVINLSLAQVTCLHQFTGVALCGDSLRNSRSVAHVCPGPVRRPG